MLVILTTHQRLSTASKYVSSTTMRRYKREEDLGSERSCPTQHGNRWLQLGGLVLALVGTILVNSSSYQLLRFIPALLSRIDDRDAAWEELISFNVYEGSLGENTSVESGARGFSPLLGLLERHARLAPDIDATRITIDGQMLYGDDSQTIGRYVVTIQYQGEDDTRVVAWVDEVSGWIDEERFRWALTVGMPVLSLGLLLSLLGGIAIWGAPRKSRLESRRKARALTPILLVVGAAVIAVFCMTVRSAALLSSIANLALVLTLLVLIRYAYDTYRIAEMTSIPSASLEFTQVNREQHPFLLASFPKNHARVPLECWCNVHPTVMGQSVRLSGFYGGRQAWYLQPYQQPHGVLDLTSAVSAAGRPVSELQEAWTTASEEGGTGRDILRLDVEFWYKTMDGRFESPHFWEGYYLDFDKRALVLHPHLGPVGGIDC